MFCDPVTLFKFCFQRIHQLQTMSTLSWKSCSKQMIPSQRTHAKQDYLFLRKYLQKLQHIPAQIAAVIFEYAFTRHVPLYHLQDFREKKEAVIWPMNLKFAYGISFTPKRDFECTGIQIYGNFGKVKTYAWLGMDPQELYWAAYRRGCSNPHKMVVNPHKFNVNASVREFVFEKEQRSLLLPKGKEIRIGFFFSDNVSLTMFGETKMMHHTVDITNVKWLLFDRNKWMLSGYRAGGYFINFGDDSRYSYHWYPLVRLLC